MRFVVYVSCPANGTADHVMPSLDSRNPTKAQATNLPWAKITSYKGFVVPETRAVHVTPSGDVRIVPPLPTATHSPLP
jgi:hypothetical protein